MATFFPKIPHIEDCQKRIRAYLSGVYFIDTKQAKLVWLHPRYPTYFFLRSELPQWYLTPVSQEEDKIVYSMLLASGHPGCVTLFITGDLAGLFTVEFSAMEAWFEEDEQIFVHPKDPYKRVDILQSSRHVRIELNGIEVANSRAPRLLFETGLPVRTYIPKTDCRIDLMKASPLRTGCPYKGEAHYYNMAFSTGVTVENVAWWYPNTTLEGAPIRGFVAFFDEKVDVFVDDEKQDRPLLI